MNHECHSLEQMLTTERLLFSCQKVQAPPPRRLVRIIAQFSASTYAARRQARYEWRRRRQWVTALLGASGKLKGLRLPLVTRETCSSLEFLVAFAGEGYTVAFGRDGVGEKFVSSSVVAQVARCLVDIVVS